LQAGQLFHGRLGLFGIVPQVGRFGLFLQLFEFDFFPG
jgi:hypothetical protein